MNIKTPLVYYKLRHFEFWPWYILYLPLLPYLLWLLLKNRTLSLFAFVNPAIPMGGLYGESKQAILTKLPQNYLPKSIYLADLTVLQVALSQMEKAQLNFPIVIKPDVGERGNGVEKISNAAQLAEYLQNSSGKLIIQEFIMHEEEAGVFFYKMPGQTQGKISSLAYKEFLTVLGDGKSTIKTLMEQSHRARFQIKRLSQSDNLDMKQILPFGERLLLEPIGNHSRGTIFTDACSEISPEMEKVFSEVLSNFDGFYYGRFDIKVKSKADLKVGQNFVIMELNGVSSEPCHIYQPGFSLRQAYRDLYKHWRIAAAIAAKNKSWASKPVVEQVMLATAH